MDFWQTIALAGIVISSLIGVSEALQLLLQRKLLIKIDKKLSGIDIEAVMARTEEATKEAFKALESALIAVLEPIRDKAVGLDAKVLIDGGIDRALEKLDVAALANQVADIMVQRAQEAIPAIVTEAKENVIEGTPGAEGALALLEGFEDNPLLSMIAMAASRKMAAQPQLPAGNSQASSPGKRRI